MIEEYNLEYSSYCQTFQRDGKSVEINIFRGDEEGWLLEVIDEYNNSTVWDDPFESDDEAFKEAIDTIENEGISALIGSAPKSK